MRILILTPWYAPFIHPRAHRWTALAEHWAGEGHTVDIICTWYPGMPRHAVVKGVQVHRFGYFGLKEIFYHLFGSRQARGRVGQAPAPESVLKRGLYLMYKQVWQALYFPDDALFWVAPAVRAARRMIKAQPPDLLITVSMPFSAHLAGLFLKRGQRELYWVADIGDPFSLHVPPFVNPMLYGRLSRRMEELVLTGADKLVLTTPALSEAYRRHFSGFNEKKVAVIPPLLRSGPAPHAYQPDPDHIHLGWFGALYPELRTPDLLLDWLNRLLDCRPDWQKLLILHWYGEVPPEHLKRLAAHPNIRLYGLRPRAEVQAAMARMDVLLHIGNRSTFQLPSKAVDYLAAARPVLHFRFVDPDPFVEFWPSPQDLFVWNAADGASAAERMAQSVAFVESARNMRPIRPGTLLEPYRVEALARAYLTVM